MGMVESCGSEAQGKMVTVRAAEGEIMLLCSP